MHPRYFVNNDVLWIIEARIAGGVRATPDSHEADYHEFYQRRNEKQHRRCVAPEHWQINAQAAVKEEEPDEYDQANGMRKNRNGNSDQ